MTDNNHPSPSGNPADDNPADDNPSFTAAQDPMGPVAR